MQEFFLQTKGEYSISGKEDVPDKAAKNLLRDSLDCQVRNSPSMKDFAVKMKKKYKL
jgi:hypothetical protein